MKESDELKSCKNELVMAEMLLGAIEMALGGVEPSDFELSFPIVRDVWDMHCLIESVQE